MHERYNNEYNENARLEFIWCSREHVNVRILQLMEPLWYYSLGDEAVPSGEIVGIGISNLSDLINEYTSNFPFDYTK